MRTSCAVLAVLLLVTLSGAAQERVDFPMLEKIRAEGLERSKILDTFNYLVTVIGPRLTNSPAHKRAVEWTQEQAKAMGFANVHAEKWQFGRGWTLDKVVGRDARAALHADDWLRQGLVARDRRQTHRRSRMAARA